MLIFLLKRINSISPTNSLLFLILRLTTFPNIYVWWGGGTALKACRQHPLYKINQRWPWMLCDFSHWARAPAVPPTVLPPLLTVLKVTASCKILQHYSSYIFKRYQIVKVVCWLCKMGGTCLCSFQAKLSPEGHTHTHTQTHTRTQTLSSECPQRKVWKSSGQWWHSNFWNFELCESITYSEIKHYSSRPTESESPTSYLPEFFKETIFPKIQW